MRHRWKFQNTNQKCRNYEREFFPHEMPLLFVGLRHIVAPHVMDVELLPIRKRQYAAGADRRSITSRPDFKTVGGLQIQHRWTQSQKIEPVECSKIDMPVHDFSVR